MKKPLLFLPLSVGLLALPPQADAPFDLLLTGGRVVDGTGAPWFAADVGVRDGKIAAVGVLAGHPAGRVIDARGLVVAPGFIDLLGQSEYNVLVDKRAASKITQGITTEVTGEGDSIAPVDQKALDEGKDTWKKYGVFPDWKTLDGYFRSLERRGTAINMATFVGSGMKTTPAELQQKRIQTCGACEHHTGMRCKICGCFTHVKIKMAHEDCPIGKWPG